VSTEATSLTGELDVIAIHNRTYKSLQMSDENVRAGSPVGRNLADTLTSISRSTCLCARAYNIIKQPYMLGIALMYNFRMLNKKPAHQEDN
jgi:hypothetical protein